MLSVVTDRDFTHIDTVYRREPLEVTRRVLMRHVVERRLFAESRDELHKVGMDHVWTTFFTSSQQS